MRKNIAIILSGCGVFDGSEIYEATLTLLRIGEKGAGCFCFAPNIQHDVINHMTGESTNESRNVLIESARLARGNIKNLVDLDIDNYDGVIVPGGFGAAKNLSNYAVENIGFSIDPVFSKCIKQFISKSKPVGLICISPIMAGHFFDTGVRCTIGDDENTANDVIATGAEHVNCCVDDIVVDEKNKLVTTPAFMKGETINQVKTGIDKLVDKILEMV